jgi:Holliday junction resolvase RusA-like endonuclease
MKCDSDNIIKPIVDLLVRAEIVPDDKTRFINSVKVRYLQGFGAPVTCISYCATDD